MRTNRLQYSHSKSTFKTLLLAFVAAFFLSACGIKGKLYQTPEQAVTEQDTAEAASNKVSEKETNKSSEVEEQEAQLLEKPVTQENTKKDTQQPIEQPTEPSINQEKEQQ